MSDIDAVKKYLEWQEEQVLAGVADARIERYEEHLARVDMADRMKQIRELATEPVEGGADEALELIARLAS